MYFGYKSLIRYMICTYFLSFCGLSFQLLSRILDDVICSTKVYNLDEVQLNLFLFFCCLCLWHRS